MDLTWTAAETAFRDRVRGFLRSNLPDWLSAKVRKSQRLTRDDHVFWHAALAAQGWLAPLWPKAHGGAEWTAVERHIWEEEAAAAHAPWVVPFGVGMLGPVLIAYGTGAQQAHYLPRILSGADWWAQGYSEPGAGSDLASLRAKAVRDGDHYIVNGQKTWTTLAQHANMIFALVRTREGGKPQEGISFLLIDLTAPGVTVRPILLLNREHEVNEVFFDNVRVPVENLVGEEHKGWTCAKYLLAHERTGIAGVGTSTEALRVLKQIARAEEKDGRPLSDDPDFAGRIAAVEIELDALRTTNLRVLAAAGAGESAGIMASMLKIRGSELRQRIDSLTREALGPFAIPFVAEAFDAGSNQPGMGPAYANPVAATYFNNRKISIYGGSNEIQRGLIVKGMMQAALGKGSA